MITALKQNTITSSILTVLAVMLVFSAVAWPQVGKAKSATWSKSYSLTLKSRFMESHPLSNPSVTIKYYANILNCDTNNKVLDGETIPVGTKLLFNPVSHKDTDISWVGTGAAMDTPYGHWVKKAVAPEEVSCLSQDFINEHKSNDFGWIRRYIPLNVNPPKITIDTSASTAGLKELSNGCYEVTSPGKIKPAIVFEETYGKFYHEMWFQRERFSSMPDQHCFGDGVALFRSLTPDTTFIMNVPSRTISFNLTAVDTNNPPNPPRINGSFNGTTEITRNVVENFRFRATDPDGDDIRYLIDWNMDGEVDMRRPAGADGNWTTSGTAIYQGHKWSSAGTYTFQAKTRDENGQDSDWTQHTVVINQGISITSCTASPNPADVGEPVTWTVNHNGGTGPYTYSWSGSGGLDGTSKSVTKSYSNYGNGQKVANVTVTDSVGASVTADCNILTLNAPAIPGMTGSITANPGTIDAGGSTNVTWNSSNTESCFVWSDPDMFNWSGTNGTQPATLNQPTDFVLECRPNASAPYELIDYVSVNVNMPPQCSDGVDNDWDGDIDMEDDGCSDPTDDNENDDPVIPTDPQCSDGVDNADPEDEPAPVGDGTELADDFDPGCWTDPTDSSTYDPTDDDETNTQCSDGLNNDGDSENLIDMADPDCTDPTDDDEGPGGASTAPDGDIYANTVSGTLSGITSTDSVTLTWESTDADYCEVQEAGTFLVDGLDNMSGYNRGTLPEKSTTVFELHCENATTPLDKVDEVTVIVDPDTVATVPTGNIYANNNGGAITVDPTTSVTLTWESWDADDCRVTDGITDFSTARNNMSTGHDLSTLPANSVNDYELQCRQGSDPFTVMDVVRVTVTSGTGSCILGTPGITANPDYIVLGDSVELTWNLGTCAVGTCTITGSGITNGSMQPAQKTGSTSVTPTGNSTYTLDCDDAVAPDDATVEVEQSGQET